MLVMLWEDGGQEDVGFKKIDLLIYYINYYLYNEYRRR